MIKASCLFRRAGRPAGVPLIRARPWWYPASRKGRNPQYCHHTLLFGAVNADFPEFPPGGVFGVIRLS